MKNSGDKDANVNRMETRMKKVFGFDWNDLSSWENFVRLMCSPRDPSSLAVWRIMFGILMVIDLPQERGLAYIDVRFGDPNECRFPLFDFLQPLPLEWMCVVYMVLLAGAIGCMLGLFYRISCLMMLVPYWYIFFLDKTRWNNHSYLYGLIMFMFTLTDANRCWSLDSWLFKRKRNAQVPLWNYAIFRAQFFLVYFIAGLKKLDSDWVLGYSMNEISRRSWVFSPFKYVLTDDQIDLFMVHYGGLALDLSSGYLLFFDVTRPLGTLFLTSFHLMNSQIFSIGMFPFTCLASTPLFYSDTWPKYLLGKMPKFVQRILPSISLPQSSSHCLYKETTKSEEKVKEENVPNLKNNHQGASFYHHLCTAIFALYIVEQAFLPYSHGLTKGYNNWTNGLYGYSWDMMVHTWNVQVVRITVKERGRGMEHFINPTAWTSSRRWNSNADMVKQYVSCIEERLVYEGLKNMSIYVDVFRSLNDRFQQRMFDPRVNILTAEWHPFKETTWVLPLMVDLSNWRDHLAKLEKQVLESNDTDVFFMADFPGLEFDQFIPKDLGNTTLTLLDGEVNVEFGNEQENVSMKAGDVIQVPPDEYHVVHTVSKTPSCYMYLFVNSTQKKLVEEIKDFYSLDSLEADVSTQTDSAASGFFPEDTPFADVPDLSDLQKDHLRVENSQAAQLYEEILQIKEEMNIDTNTTFLQRKKDFVWEKFMTFYRSYEMSSLAIRSIWTGIPMKEIIKETGLYSDEVSGNQDDLNNDLDGDEDQHDNEPV